MTHEVKLYTAMKEEAIARYGRSSIGNPMGYHDNDIAIMVRNNMRTPSSIMRHKNQPCIAPSIPSIMGQDWYRADSFESICNHLSISLPQVRRDMEAIKKKRIHFVQIGYGGFGINSLHFMSLFAARSGVYHPFEKLDVYENDEFTFLNAMRIYKDVSKINVNDYQMSKLLLFEEERNLSSHVTLHDKYFKIEDTNRRKAKTVYVGAPDFDTRQAMEEKNFIFTGHSGNEVELYSRPVINQDVMTETYGIINLPWFYMNLIKATAELLSILAKTDEYPKDTSLFLYSSERSLIAEAGVTF